MACENCNSAASPVPGDDLHHCPGCGWPSDAISPDMSAGKTMVRTRGQLGSDLGDGRDKLNRDQRRQYVHNSRAKSDSYETWIIPIKEELKRLVSPAVATRSFSLIKRANRDKQLGTYRRGLKGLREIENKVERTEYRRRLFALASVDVLSEIEMEDYGTDSLFVTHEIPPHDRNWAVKRIRPPVGFSIEDEEDRAKQVQRNTISRTKQISRWLVAIEEHLRRMFPSEESTQVVNMAKEILREEWHQPVSEGDHFGLTQYTNIPSRRVTMSAVLEAMSRNSYFGRKDRTDLWDAFPVKGMTKDSIR